MTTTCVLCALALLAGCASSDTRNIPALQNRVGLSLTCDEGYIVSKLGPVALTTYMAPQDAQRLAQLSKACREGADASPGQLVLPALNHPR